MSIVETDSPQVKAPFSEGSSATSQIPSLTGKVMESLGFHQQAFSGTNLSEANIFDPAKRDKKKREDEEITKNIAAEKMEEVVDSAKAAYSGWEANNQEYVTKLESGELFQDTNPEAFDRDFELFNNAVADSKEQIFDKHPELLDAELREKHPELDEIAREAESIQEKGAALALDKSGGVEELPDHYCFKHPQGYAMCMQFDAIYETMVAAEYISADTTKQQAHLIFDKLETAERGKIFDFVGQKTAEVTYNLEKTIDNSAAAKTYAELIHDRKEFNAAMKKMGKDITYEEFQKLSSEEKQDLLLEIKHSFDGNSEQKKEEPAKEDCGCDDKSKPDAIKNIPESAAAAVEEIKTETAANSGNKEHNEPVSAQSIKTASVEAEKGLVPT